MCLKGVVKLLLSTPVYQTNRDTALLPDSRSLQSVGSSDPENPERPCFLPLSESLVKFNLDPKPQICRHRYQEVKKNPKGTDYCLASLSRFPLPSIVPFFLPFINTYQRPYSGSGSLQALGNSKMTKTQFSLGAQRPEGKQRLSSFQANELMPTTGAMGA